MASANVWQKFRKFEQHYIWSKFWRHGVQFAKLLNLERCKCWNPNWKKAWKSAQILQIRFLKKLVTKNLLATHGFDRARNEPSKVMFSYYVIPNILMYTYDIYLYRYLAVLPMRENSWNMARDNICRFAQDRQEWFWAIERLCKQTKCSSQFTSWWIFQSSRKHGEYSCNVEDQRKTSF